MSVESRRDFLGGLLVVAAFLLPFLAFGGRALGWAVLVSAILCASAALVLGLPVRGAGASLPVPRLAKLAAGVVLASGLFGLLPLPPAVAGFLSPSRLALHEAVPRGPQGMESWAEAADPAPRSISQVLAEMKDGSAGAGRAAVPLPWLSTSFDPGRTKLALPVAAAFLALVLVLSTRRDEKLGRRVSLVVLACIAAGCAYGILQARLGTGLIYGVFPPQPHAPLQPYGTFYNANHFAGLAAMACPWLLALALDGREHVLLRIAAWLMLLPAAGAVLDAGSRGGLLCGAAGAVLLALFLLRAPGRRVHGALLAAVSVAGLVLAFTVFSDRLLHETFTETVATSNDSNALRAEYYRREAAMGLDAPFTGVGLGAFPTAYSAWKRTPESAVPLHGESDWFESFAEGGFPLFGAWLLLAGALAAPALRLAFAGRAPAWLLGFLAASLATLLHAAVDFHHREPAVALASLLALTTASCWARRLEGEAATATEGGGRLGLLLPGAALLVLAIVSIGYIPADLAFREAEGHALRGEWEQARDQAQRAASAAPWRAEHWALLGAAHEQLSKDPERDRQAEKRAAIEALVRAIELAPSTLGAARRAGSILFDAGALREARDAARLAVAASPSHSPTRQLYGEILLAEGEQKEALPHLAFAYAGTPVPRLAGMARQFSELLREAAEADPGRLLGAVTGETYRVFYLHALRQEGRQGEIPAYLDLMAKQGRFENPELLAGLLWLGKGKESLALAEAIEPKLTSSRALMAVAQVYADAGEGERAKAAFQKALAAPGVEEHAWIAAGDFLWHRHEIDEARSTWQRGAEAHPDNPALKRRLEMDDPAPGQP